MRRHGLLLPALLLIAVSAPAKDLTLRGFVTAVDSPTSFEIDKYKITRDPGVVLEVSRDKADASSPAVAPGEIRVGMEVTVEGDYDESTGNLTAKSIKVAPDDARKINRVALIEKPPTLQKTASGAWQGLLFADGQRIAVSDATVLLVRRNSAETKEAKKNGGDSQQFVPLVSSDVITLDTFIHYEGARQPDGSVLAARVEIEPAALSDAEAKLWKKLAPQVRPPDYVQHKPGQLKVGSVKYQLLPDQQAQEYVSRLGESLIPEHQKQLPADSPLKIPFSFYLADDKTFNADSFANGTIVVYSGLFDMLENEAQLAFVLSQEIAQVIEKADWRILHYHRGEMMALGVGGAGGSAAGGAGAATGAAVLGGAGAAAVGASIIGGSILASYENSLEDQADRVGLERMLASGYDLRQAPQAWRVYVAESEKRPWDFFAGSQHAATTRRSYLMAELKYNYPAVDYSTLKKDSADFHRIAKSVQASETPEPKPRPPGKTGMATP